ncbi:hypothetical protein ACH95_08515 [Bacillus glycinifermentans]|uniref:Uncharacterized protein n=1 Tax=Bacillus glycinifermentans TaxID=1664069 RepID=A0A2I7ZJV4_9BACI|nr:hypothetical protein [Bacillus glycinifermentans]AUS92779.1 hypothetical protein [Bacillus glycinifermentans]AUS92825.1 hypothetical protein [Bacillus glycinifermentans]KMM60801.1 hypothetical protein ACH95_08515 [Bacillus glycinifermentans]TWM23245.1 hypothetical protein CHCC15087_3804 [Bacillus licheniformis]
MEAGARVVAGFFVARIARRVRQLQERLGGLPAIVEKTPGVHVPLRVPAAGGSPSFQRKEFFKKPIEMLVSNCYNIIKEGR